MKNVGVKSGNYKSWSKKDSLRGRNLSKDLSDEKCSLLENPGAKDCREKEGVRI